MEVSESLSRGELARLIPALGDHLPAILNEGFQARLEPGLSDASALLARRTEDMPATAAMVAKGVIEWLNP